MGPHAGDLPNVHVRDDAHATIELFVDRVTLREGPRTLLDRDRSALVVPAGEVDYESEPAGEAGRRVACGAVMR
jgi:Cu-Zn family superoxide dismutase